MHNILLFGLCCRRRMGCLSCCVVKSLSFIQCCRNRNKKSWQHKLSKNSNDVCIISVFLRLPQRQTYVHIHVHVFFWTLLQFAFMTINWLQWHFMISEKETVVNVERYTWRSNCKNHSVCMLISEQYIYL